MSADVLTWIQPWLVVTALLLIVAMCIGWLFYLARGHRPIRLNVRGLGVEFTVNTVGEGERRRRERRA